MKRVFSFIIFFALGISAAVGQNKPGHLNFNNLIVLMPESKAADEALKKYQDELVAKGTEMANTFKTKAEAYYKKVQGGTIAPAAQAAEEAELKKEQEAILKYEQEVSAKVQEKRQELLKPIIEKAENAINQVAKEKGFTVIFDTSLFNTVLYADTSVDIMDLVKAKLGL